MNKRIKIDEKRKFLGLKLIETCGEIMPYLNDRDLKHKECSGELLEYALCQHNKLEDLIEFYILGKQLTDPSYPTTPYLSNMHMANIYDITAEDIDSLQEKLANDWIAERETGYEHQNSVLYKNDPTKEFFECPKNPVIGNASLTNFLDKSFYKISQSQDTLELEDYDKTFVQLMYGQNKNGKMMRFIKVVELIPTTIEIQNLGVLPTFDWAISIKAMPDDNLNHSTPIFRIESKKCNHYNLTRGSDQAYYDATDGQKTSAEYLHKKWDILYNNDYVDSHIHSFDRINQFAYLAKPLSSNVITLKYLMALCKQDFSDNVTLCPVLDELKKNKSAQKYLQELINKLDLADNRSDSPRTSVRKNGWFTKFDALRCANKFVDSLYKIEHEKEWDEVKQTLLGETFIY